MDFCSFQGSSLPVPPLPASAQIGSLNPRGKTSHLYLPLGTKEASLSCSPGDTLFSWLDLARIWSSFGSSKNWALGLLTRLFTTIVPWESLQRLGSWELMEGTRAATKQWPQGRGTIQFRAAWSEGRMGPLEPCKPLSIALT